MINVNKYQGKVDDYYFDYSYSEDLQALQKDLNDYAKSIGADQVKVTIEDHFFGNRGVLKDEPSWEIWVIFNDRIDGSRDLFGNSFSELFTEGKKAIRFFASNPI